MDPVEELGEARPVLNWISSRNSRVVELCHDLETAPHSQLSIACRCRFSLSLSLPTLAAELVR